MNKIREILEEVYQVNCSTKETFLLENNLLDEAHLATRKNALLSFGMHYLRDDFVEVVKKYPSNNQMEVELGLDFVVMQGEDYRRLMKLLDKYE